MASSSGSAKRLWLNNDTLAVSGVKTEMGFCPLIALIPLCDDLREELTQRRTRHGGYRVDDAQICLSGLRHYEILDRFER